MICMQKNTASSFTIPEQDAPTDLQNVKAEPDKTKSESKIRRDHYKNVVQVPLASKAEKQQKICCHIRWRKRHMN